jgi:periplasmic protein TonB
MVALQLDKEIVHTEGGKVTFDLGIEKQRPRISKPAQEAAEYKKHSLVAHYFGGIPQSGQPMRHIAAAEAQDTIVRGLLEMPLAVSHRKPLDWAISLTLHILVVAALVIVPLAFTQVIDISNLRATYLAMPRPPAAAAPRPPAAAEAIRRPMLVRQPQTLMAPTMIPKTIAQIKDEAPPDVGVIGGIAGGESGGVLGGVLGGSGVAALPPPAAPKKAVYRVGGNFKAPRELVKTAPEYPIIARNAHVEGVVVVDAIIDEHGDVVNARVVSGPALLIASALQAVLKWKYEPTYLDGTPVSISMEVQVNFKLM